MRRSDLRLLNRDGTGGHGALVAVQSTLPVIRACLLEILAGRLFQLSHTRTSQETSELCRTSLLLELSRVTRAGCVSDCKLAPCAGFERPQRCGHYSRRLGQNGTSRASTRTARYPVFQPATGLGSPPGPAATSSAATVISVVTCGFGMASRVAAGHAQPRRGAEEALGSVQARRRRRSGQMKRR